MRHNIKKHYSGFVPAYFSHPRSLCAYYHCKEERVDGRYCDKHARQYTSEALSRENGANVIEIKDIRESGSAGPNND